MPVELELEELELLAATATAGVIELLVVEVEKVEIEEDVEERMLVPEELRPVALEIVPLDIVPCDGPVEEWLEFDAQISGSRQVQRSFSQIPHFMKLMQLIVHCCGVHRGPVDELLPVDIIPPCPPLPFAPPAPPADVSGLPCAQASKAASESGATARAMAKRLSAA